MTVAHALAVLRERGPDRAAEVELLGEWLLAQAGLGGEAGEVTVAPGSARDSVVLRDGLLSGAAHRVPWARDAARVAGGRRHGSAHSRRPEGRHRGRRARREHGPARGVQSRRLRVSGARVKDGLTVRVGDDNVATVEFDRPPHN